VHIPRQGGCPADVVRGLRGAGRTLNAALCVSCLPAGPLDAVNIVRNCSWCVVALQQTKIVALQQLTRCDSAITDSFEKWPVLVYPELLVCLNCGKAEFTLPEDQLALLAKSHDAGK